MWTVIVGTVAAVAAASVAWMMMLASDRAKSGETERRLDR